MSKIKRITEAFSMQPISFEIGQNGFGSLENNIERIENGCIMATGDPYECYDVFDVKGNLVAQYLKETMNVIYFAGEDNKIQKGGK